MDQINILRLYIPELGTRILIINVGKFYLQIEQGPLEHLKDIVVQDGT